MSQLNNNSFKVVDTFIKDGYKVVGKWSRGVVLQKGGEIQLVPSNMMSNTACKAKTSVCDSNTKKSNKEELFKLYKSDMASEKQVLSATNTKDCGREL